MIVRRFRLYQNCLVSKKFHLLKVDQLIIADTLCQPLMIYIIIPNLQETTIWCNNAISWLFNFFLINYTHTQILIRWIGIHLISKFFLVQRVLYLIYSVDYFFIFYFYFWRRLIRKSVFVNNFISIINYSGCPYFYKI